MVQRLVRVLVWAMPSASVVLSSLALGWRWIGDRTNMVEVGKAIAPVASIAKAAQSVGTHASSIADLNSEQLNLAWAEVVLLHAELMVYADYGRANPHDRGEYIQDAKAFFRSQYETQLTKYPLHPAEAARRALSARWRPGLTQ